MAVFGARPDAINSTPLVHASGKHRDVDSRVCVTAPHRRMLDQVLELFEIKPDIDLIKLGLRVSPRPVRVPKRPLGRARGDGRRATSSRNHAKAGTAGDCYVTLIYSRQQSPRQQVQQLPIEIDEARTAHEVAEITETEYFRALALQVDRLRSGCNTTEG